MKYFGHIKRDTPFTKPIFEGKPKEGEVEVNNGTSGKMISRDGYTVVECGEGISDPLQPTFITEMTPY